MSKKEIITDKIKEIFFTFVCVTTSVVFANALYIQIFYGPGTLVEMENYWIILILSFLTSLCNLIYPAREVSKKTGIVLTLIHFVLVTAIVLGFGSYMKWYEFNDPLMLVSMVLFIALIFAAVYVMVYIRNKKMANKMNECLKQFTDEQ